MGLGFYIYLGCNRGTCQICNEKIKTNEFQIKATGYQQSGIIHLNCAIKEKDKLLQDKDIRDKVLLNSI